MGLTRRQRQVIRLLGRGMSNNEIGLELGISVHTVRIYVSEVLRALQVKNRTEAAVIAVRQEAPSEVGMSCSQLKM